MMNETDPGLITRVHESEIEHFYLSKHIVGRSGLALVEEFWLLYEDLLEREAGSGLPEKDDTSVTHFIFECAHRLALAVLSIFRLHAGDAAGHTRRAIEAASFLVAMRKDRRLFQTWLDAPDSDAKGRAYRKAFLSGIVLAKDSVDPVVVLLRKLYDFCSTLLHPRLESFAGRLRKVSDDKVDFHFFDLPPDGGPQMLKAFAWTLEAHTAVLRYLAASYREDLKLAEIGWLERFARLDDAVKRFRANAEGGTPETSSAAT